MGTYIAFQQAAPGTQHAPPSLLVPSIGTALASHIAFQQAPSVLVPSIGTPLTSTSQLEAQMNGGSWVFPNGKDAAAAGI